MSKYVGFVALRFLSFQKYQADLIFQERIQQALKEVRLKAAQQRLILESSLEKSGHSIQPISRAEDENDLPSRDVDMPGPSAQTVTTERQQETARSVVLAVQVKANLGTCLNLYLKSNYFQDHINLVYRTADFVKEARSCMGSLVHNMMMKSLQVKAIANFSL